MAGVPRGQPGRVAGGVAGMAADQGLDDDAWSALDVRHPLDIRYTYAIETLDGGDAPDQACVPGSRGVVAGCCIHDAMAGVPQGQPGPVAGLERRWSGPGHFAADFAAALRLRSFWRS